MKKRLDIADLKVSSFSPAGSDPMASQATGSEGPDCIVYVSDCVSCPMEPETGGY